MCKISIKITTIKLLPFILSSRGLNTTVESCMMSQGEQTNSPGLYPTVYWLVCNGPQQKGSQAEYQPPVESKSNRAAEY